MKEKYIVDIKTNDDFTDYYMVKEAALKIGTNKKQYLDLLLADMTGEIRAKKWDVDDEEAEGLKRINEGSIIKVKATVTEWNGTKQLRVQKIRLTGAEDQLVNSDFFKSAPEESESMFKYIEDRAKEISDKHFSSIVLKVLNDNKEKFMYYPAASKNHHAEYGGLLYHMKRMLVNAISICEVYPILNKDLLATGVILHDMEKLNEMDSDTNGVVSGYTFEGMMLGHLVQGAIAVDRLSRDLDIPYEKKIMLEHMLISHHYEPDWGSPKMPLFPEAEILHYLDMIDAKMYDFEEALNGVEPGDFSDKSWTLDRRRIYKREW